MLAALIMVPARKTAMVIEAFLSLRALVEMVAISPPSAAAVENVIWNANAVASRLERSDYANEQVDLKVIDDAKAVSGLRDAVDEASTLLKGTLVGSVRAISMPGDFMIDTSAATELGDAIRDAKEETGQAKTSDDGSRRVSCPEDVIIRASPISDSEAWPSAASRASVLGNLIDGTILVLAWRNEHDGSRAANLLGDGHDSGLCKWRICAGECDWERLC